MNEAHLVSKAYLRDFQYKDASNLDARAALHRRFGTNPYPWHRWPFDQLLDVAPSAGNVLEVGAGNALLWVANRERIPSGWQITLTDFSPGMLDDARTALGADASRFVFTQADVEALPFGDGTYDVVIANHMLYHVSNRPRALAEIARALRPGGALIAATNGEANLTEMIDMIAPDAPEADAWRQSFARGFTLGNGADQLQQVFMSVEMREYEDGLAVNEVEPLLAYIAAMDYPSLRDPQRFASVEARIRERMAAEGTLHLTKRVGLFVARH